MSPQKADSYPYYDKTSHKKDYHLKYVRRLHDGADAEKAGEGKGYVKENHDESGKIYSALLLRKRRVYDE